MTLETAKEGLLVIKGDTTNKISNWLPLIAGQINDSFRKLRDDIRMNTVTFSPSQYSERIAHAYYDVASICNKIQGKSYPGLTIMETYLTKCLEKLEICRGQSIQELRSDVKSLLRSIRDLKNTTTALNSRENNRSIQILELVINLENHISTPLKINLQESVEASKLLGELYELAHVFNLSTKYKSTANFYEKKGKGLNKAEVRYLIRMEVELEYSELEKVKNRIQKGSRGKSPQWVEKAYIHFLLGCVEKEVTSLLQGVSIRDRKNIISDFVDSLTELKPPLSTLPHFPLLFQQISCVSKEDEKKFMLKLKKLLFRDDSLYKSCEVEVKLLQIRPSYSSHEGRGEEMFSGMEKCVSFEEFQNDTTVVDHVSHFLIQDFPNTSEYNEFAKIDGEFVVQVHGEDEEFNRLVLNHLNESMVSSPNGTEVETNLEEEQGGGCYENSRFMDKKCILNIIVYKKINE